MLTEQKNIETHAWRELVSNPQYWLDKTILVEASRQRYMKDAFDEDSRIVGLGADRLWPGGPAT